MDNNSIADELGKLLEPVTADAPCGVDVEYDEAFTGILSEIETIEDFSTWRGIAKSIQSLMEKTRDIRVLALNSRASMYTSAFPVRGLAENLFLLRHWVENYWDCLYPRKDEEFPDEAYEARVNAIADMGAWSLVVLPLRQKLPSLSIGLGSYTLNDLSAFAQGNTVDGLQAPVGLLENEQMQYDELTAWFRKALEEALAVKALLKEKTGSFVEFDKYLIPALRDGVALGGRDVNAASTQVAADDIGDSTAQQSMQSAMPVKKTVPQGVNSRDDVIKSIDLICGYYQQYEPSSPVPLLLARAKLLVKKDFRDILSELRLGSSGDIDHLFGRVE